METSVHSLNSLFDQLGLDDSDQAIDIFFQKHKPVPHNVLLYQAEIWSPSQAAFLKEAIEEDADWALVVDRLDALLR